jgi:hypothetical protein
VGSALLYIGVAAACALMLWASYKIEPHWVSKDGERLVCYGQGLGRDGAPQGRWREMRVRKTSGHMVEVRPRRGSLSVAGSGVNPMKRRAQRVSHWKVIGQSPMPPRKRVVYLLGSSTDPGMPEMVALRLPANSRAIPMLESLATNKTAVSASQPSRGTPRSEAQPDRN